MKNFWKKIKKPILILSPMAGVTDAAFRRLFAKYGKPDVMWTEFVSADGLCSSGKKRLLKDLIFSKKEHPIVAQIFSAKPEKISEAAKIIKKLGFDGIDINMGCPDRKVEKQGAGAALMKNPELAKEIIRKAKAAAGLPVSVKTRIGYNAIDLNWIEELLKENLSALTVHLRTRKEMSSVPAHWEVVPKIIKLRDKLSKGTLIIGNGDVTSIKDAKEKAKRYGCDGIMIGRAALGKPWFFGKEKTDIEKRLKILVEHAKLFEKLFKSVKNFAEIRKHFKAYVEGFDGAKELRIRLMTAENSNNVSKVISGFLKRKVV